MSSGSGEEVKVTKAKVMEALGDPGLGLMVMQMIELPRVEQQGEDGCHREPGEGRVKERLGHKPQGGRALHGIRGTFSQSSIREHGVRHLQLLTDISGLWKKEQFLIEKPAGEATFWGKTKFQLARERKSYALKSLRKQEVCLLRSWFCRGGSPQQWESGHMPRGKTAWV